MSTNLRRSAASLLSLLLFAVLVQANPLPSLKEAKACSMSQSLILMRPVDARGAPLPGASMKVWRLSTKALLTRAESFGGPGDYLVLEDGELPDLRPEGEFFEVEIQNAGRSRRVRLRIGLDATRCHVKVLEGDTRVVF